MRYERTYFPPPYRESLGRRALRVALVLAAGMALVLLGSGLMWLAAAVRDVGGLR